MKIGSNWKLKSLIAAAAIVGLSGMPSVQAADCKGMSESKCTDSGSCTWVSGYKTKSGKEVASYCRNKSSKKKGMEKSKAKKDAAKADKKASKKSAKTDEKSSKKAAKSDKKAAKSDKKASKKKAKDMKK